MAGSIHTNTENPGLSIEEENAALKMKQVELEGRIRYLADQEGSLTTRLRVKRGDFSPPPSSRGSPIISPTETEDETDHSHPSRPRRRYPTFNTNDFKVDVPEYDGRLDPDAFLEWLQTVERVFDYKTVPDSKKMPLPSFYGLLQPRVALPLEMAPEPVYVNAKQYHGILRRRQIRAKAELERKLIKSRKPYLHESRHRHALRRARASGGRFAKKAESDAANHSAGKGNKTSDFGGSLSLKAKEEASNGYRADLAGEGQSNQQWAGMSSDHAPQFALAI